MAAAVRAGLDVLALTDHDTVAGWDEAVQAAREEGLTLVRGIEVSTLHGGRSVHLLAYLPDPEHPGLRSALEEVRAARMARLPRILARLQEAGSVVGEDDVRRVSEHAVAAGRPHIADALVAVSEAVDRTDAMQRLLAPGTPGWVPRTAVELVDAVALVRAAGGVPVLAHPWGRGARGVLDVDALTMLAQQGLVGIEVDHPDHSRQHRRELRALAHDLGLVVTGASDHHGTGKVGHALGSETTDPVEYARLLEAAGVLAKSSGRPAPAIVSG